MTPRKTAVRLIAICWPLLAALSLFGCSSTDNSTHEVSSTQTSPSSSPNSSTPVTLAPRRETSQSVAMPLNPDELAKAIERFRITKKKPETPYEQAGADLNSDGRPEALVLLTGPDWCSPQGCTLVVFQPSDVGLRQVSQTIGVKPPIAVGPGSNAGWRDLVVKTGASKIVRLQFSGGGYPINAQGQPDATSDVPSTEVLIQPQSGRGQANATSTTPSANQ